MGRKRTSKTKTPSRNKGEERTKHISVLNSDDESGFDGGMQTMSRKDDDEVSSQLDEYFHVVHINQLYERTSHTISDRRVLREKEQGPIVRPSEAVGV